jgi:hypothetical protein
MVHVPLNGPGPAGVQPRRPNGSVAASCDPVVEQTGSQPLGEETVANVEDEDGDFEQFDLPTEELSDAELFPAVPAADEEQAVPGADGPLAAELMAGEEETEPEEEQTEEEAKPTGGFLKTLSQANPYTVMLAVALAAILTAMICLVLELSTYNFDVGASDYQQRAE